jgi:hypothetical protein
VPVHSFHLGITRLATTARALVRPPSSRTVSGLHHVETMTTMQLGAPVVALSRVQPRHLAMFASWDDEAAIDEFLIGTSLGRELAAGWHVRLEFLRRWGRITEFDALPAPVADPVPDEPVIAVTLARLKLPQVPRFIRWGRPVERLVRDHPGTTLALAAMRLPRTVSTFSVWRSEREMTDMVHGRTPMPNTELHAEAMVERRRKDFHHEFTTLRFRSLGEYGTWEGRGDIVPRV